MGQAGADTLDGGLGADSMTGGLGDDRYVVDATTDRITEATSQGRDEVVSSVSLTLGSNLEDLTLVGTVNGTGNGLANTLTGSAQANSLSGAGGNDRLVGEAGNDILSGGT